MKSNLKYLVLGILIFMVCFAGFRPQAASLYAHREDTSVIANPQILTPGQWNPVEFTSVQWLGEQFTWNPSVPTRINLQRGNFHPIVMVAIKSTADRCEAHILLTTTGSSNEIGISQVPVKDGFAFIPVEPYDFISNPARGSYLQVEAKCDNVASISFASMYLTNQ